jgi:hypothetical protein
LGLAPVSGQMDRTREQFRLDRRHILPKA